MHIIRTAAHVAYLHPLTGEGLLILPHPEQDVRDPFAGPRSASLHASDWQAIVSQLRGEGWEPSEDEDGGWVDEGLSYDGRQIIGLYGWDPITSDPALDVLVNASAELIALARSSAQP